MSDKSTSPKASSMRKDKKKTSDFVCDMRFGNDLPDPSAKVKLLTIKRDADRYCKYQVTSLEKNWKPQLYLEPDLGIPLDLLDMSVYNPPKGEKITLDPEDEALLRDDDDEPITRVNEDGLKTKEKPTDKDFPWLVKTQYISPLTMDSTKQSRIEKQAKEFRESRQNILKGFKNREENILDIMASFEACKSKPIHKVDCRLKPESVLPLFPYFERYNDQVLVANFDSAPIDDSKIYGKLNAADHLEPGSRAIMKSFITSSSDSKKPDIIFAYMLPSIDELKNGYDENEEVSYSWVRDYHCDMLQENVDDPRTYLVVFGESEAKYLPLPKTLVLRKRMAREGKSGYGSENSPVPETVIIRNRSTT